MTARVFRSRLVTTALVLVLLVVITAAAAVPTRPKAGLADTAAAKFRKSTIGQARTPPAQTDHEPVVAVPATPVVGAAAGIPATPGPLPSSPGVSSGVPPAEPSVSLPGVSASEVAVRLLLDQESHMAEMGPACLLAIARFFAYLAVLTIATLWWWQSSLLYMPAFGRTGEAKQTNRNPQGFRSPSEYGLPYEECWITAPDGVVTHAWLILQPAAASAPTIVFFHGNAGNIGYRLPNAKSLYYTCRANILLIDYRGYGHSAGEPSEQGLRMDALAAIKYLREDRMDSLGYEAKPVLDLTRIYLFGRSLGGAVVIATASADQQALASRAHSHPPIAGLLLENTFCTLIEIVLVLGSRLGLVVKESTMIHTSTAARFLRAYLGWLMTNRWASLDAVPSLRTPMLFLSGLADELIPPCHMSGLFAAAASTQTKQLHTVPRGTHNDTFVVGGMEYFQAMAEFMQSTGGQARPQDLSIGNGSKL